MIKHYCRNCGLSLGLIQYVDPITDFTGSVGSYKFDKYFKHTSLPVSASSVISVFDQTDYDTYRDYIISTAISGSVEIDDKGRTNLIWFAKKPTGQATQLGQPNQSTDGVKLVLHDNPLKIHAFPTGSSGFSSAKCDGCGDPVTT